MTTKTPKPAPLTSPGCPTSRSFFASCRIPQPPTASPPKLSHPPGRATRRTLDVYQMPFERPPPAVRNQVMRKLTHADVPEMLALTRLTDPGPFLPRTIDLGAYYGIHDSGSLVALAGERL